MSPISKNLSDIKLIIGLGNPEKTYQKTRHNIGHQIIDLLPPAPPKTFYLKSDQFMNHSGIYIQKMVNFYKIDLKNLYLVHDDLDLPVGEWRLQFDRGPAGHHGIESAIAHLNSQAFWRFRIGIGHPLDLTPVEDYVLKPFSSNEKKIIDKIIPQITDKIISI